MLCMKIMTRMGEPVLKALEKTGGDFVRCIHSVGQPRPVKSNICTLRIGRKLAVQE